MADPKQKSLEAPFLWRIPTIWRMPQWQQAAQWRFFVYNQPIAMLCRGKLINYLLGLPWEVASKNPDEKDDLEEDINYYTNWVFRNFDIIFDMQWQDALDLPIGGTVEILRFRPDDKPVIQEGDEEYKVTRTHPKGHVFKLLNIDGASLFPTYEPDIPLAQKIPELESVVYFTENEVGRIGIQPRTEMRLKGYFKPPPEQVFLAMQMVSDADHFYNNLLKEVPPVGILDLIDMNQQDASDWVGSVRSLFEGNDPFKIPVLYQHTAPASFIPFGKSPQELLFDTASLRYARVVAASYGLTLGNLGLEPKGESLAGSIRDDMQASQGYGYVVEKTKGLIDSQILPPYLEWNVKVQDFEKLTGKGRAFLVVAQALKAAKEIGAIKPSEVQSQLVRDGFITVEVEPPNDEELAQQAQMKQLPFGQKPGANGKEAANQLTDKVPPAEGGLGDVKKEKADTARDRGVEYEMTKALEPALAKLATKATPARLARLTKAVTRAIFSLAQKAALPDDWEKEIDRIIAAETWYTLPDSLADTLASVYRAAFSNGASDGAQEIMQALGDTGFTLDFNLTNPRTLAQLEKKAALLVQRINEGTRFYLKRALVSGVEEGLSSPNIAQLIQDGAGLDDILKDGGFLDEVAAKVKAETESLTPARVESITNTEINRAESEGRLKQWDKMGLTRKAWRTYGDACEICRGNEALGFVEMAHVYEDVFDGTQGPPAHPQVCRCHLEFDEAELMDKAGELTVWSGD